MTEFEQICNKLAETQNATDEELLYVINNSGEDEYLYKKADSVRRGVYGNKVYIRGLIEISSYCKNDCLYCGIRASNRCAERYRLNEDMILECCRIGYGLGFRTFVMQGGEDMYYTDDVMCDIIQNIKHTYPDCAVTLSLGERSRQSYQRLFDAGADRYLLRHETANPNHYEYLHPSGMKLEERKKCLFDLRDIGYQVGSGFMVGSPGQKNTDFISDIRFLQELRPHMIGIGPYISHKETPFCNEKNGSSELTVKLVAMLRLLFPKALLPATTALASISENGREKALAAGANVVMPNLSPEVVRDKYSLYDNKAHSGSEAAESLELLKKRVESAGYEIEVSRGDAKS